MSARRVRVESTSPVGSLVGRLVVLLAATVLVTLVAVQGSSMVGALGSRTTGMPVAEAAAVTVAATDAVPAASYRDAVDAANIALADIADRYGQIAPTADGTGAVVDVWASADQDQTIARVSQAFGSFPVTIRILSGQVGSRIHLIADAD